MDALEIVQQNADTLIGEEQLKERLSSGRPLRVKLGVDPTRPDLTFGHMVVFNKLRQFQDLGHKAVLIIGDFTTLIGDPSGRSATRPVLGKEEIEENAATYLEQAFRILNEAQTEVRRNSEWFSAMGFENCLSLARQMTVARMLERDDFSKRYEAGSPISIVEFLYPLVQGYDSIMVEADVELGGTDQLFNLLVGRDLQRQRGMPEQACLTMPLLVGLDGEKKMSKSADNYIAFNDNPKEMFGKIMSISDEVMWAYYELLLLETRESVTALRAGHPMEAKKSLAARLVDKLHGDGKGTTERAHFESVFSQNQIPDEMPEFAWSDLVPTETAPLGQILSASKLFPSGKEAKRLVQQGAVKVNGETVNNPQSELSRPTEPLVIQSGKRLFFRVTA